MNRALSTRHRYRGQRSGRAFSQKADDDFYVCNNFSYGCLAFLEVPGKMAGDARFLEQGEFEQNQPAVDEIGLALVCGFWMAGLRAKKIELQLMLLRFTKIN